MQEREIDWPMISIVAVNLNGKKWVGPLFKSILESNYPREKLEIIFVDNGSKDGSTQLVKSMFINDSRLKIIQNRKNLGWSPANNQGMKIATGDLIVCISNDMVVDANWLKEIAKAMSTDNKIGIIQCNSISMWDRKSSDSGMNFLDRFGYAYSYAPTNENFEVFYAEGMAFGIRKEVIKEIGVLDEYFFMEYDDMDYSWRARLAGYKVIFVTKAKVYHARGGTVGSTYFDRINNAKWYTRNHVVTIIKNYDFSTMVPLIPIILSVELAKILYLLIRRGKQTLALAAFKGLFQVLKDMPIIIRKRVQTQSMRRVPDKQILEAMHPFNPWSLRMFLVLQAKGQRLSIKQ